MHTSQPLDLCVHTCRARYGHDAAPAPAEEREEGLSDAQTAEEVDLHAAAVR